MSHILASLTWLPESGATGDCAVAGRLSTPRSADSSPSGVRGPAPRSFDADISAVTRGLPLLPEHTGDA